MFCKIIILSLLLFANLVHAQSGKVKCKIPEINGVSRMIVEADFNDKGEISSANADVLSLDPRVGRTTYNLSTEPSSIVVKDEKVSIRFSKTDMIIGFGIIASAIVSDKQTSYRGLLSAYFVGPDRPRGGFDIGNPDDGTGVEFWENVVLCEIN